MPYSAGVLCCCTDFRSHTCTSMNDASELRPKSISSHCFLQFLDLAMTQLHSPITAAHPAAASTSSSSQRPKSAIYCRTEISLAPRHQTVGSTPIQQVSRASRVGRPSQSQKCEEHYHVTSVPADAKEGLATSAAIEASTGLSEYPRPVKYSERSAARVGKGQPRVRPRSAVARVETTTHYGAEVRIIVFFGRRRSIVLRWYNSLLSIL